MYGAGVVTPPHRAFVLISSVSLLPLVSLFALMSGAALSRRFLIVSQLYGKGACFVQLRKRCQCDAKCQKCSHAILDTPPSSSLQKPLLTSHDDLRYANEELGIPKNDNLLFTID